jgi:pimeloyl-ACP methyl ester carboxylesterase
MAILTGSDVVERETSSGTVRVRDTGGDGPAVLLVHSLLVDGDLYATLVPLLVAQGRRCIVPDLPLGAHQPPLRPGADLSPCGLANLAAEVLDALAVDVADIVGVDTGGAIAQLLMAYHRHRVGRVVLTACDAYECFPPPAVKPFRLLRFPGIAALAAVLLRLRLVRNLVNLRQLTHASVDDATIRRWTSPLRSPGVRRDLRAVVSGIKPEVTIAAAAANADFPRPVLVAWGDDDRVFPRRLGERLAADLPDARLITLSDSAAFAALDSPGELARLIDAHLGPAQRAADRLSPPGAGTGAPRRDQAGPARTADR